MLDWILKIFEALAALGFLYELWKSRNVLARRTTAVYDWLFSFIAAEYRNVYKSRRINRLTAIIEGLQSFSHQQEMECLSKIFSRISTIGIILLYASIYGCLLFLS